MLRHYELVEVANNFLYDNYGMKLLIPLEFNSRLKRVLGRFIYKNSSGVRQPLKIELSVDFMQTHPNENIIDVLKHELVHYALFTKGGRFSDGDYEFESELKRLGIKRTHTYKMSGHVHRYKCKNCMEVIERKRKLVSTAYCSCSQGPNLEYLGMYDIKPDPVAN